MSTNNLPRPNGTTCSGGGRNMLINSCSVSFSFLPSQHWTVLEVCNQNKQTCTHIIPITNVFSLLLPLLHSSTQQCYTGLGFGSHHGSSGGLAAASAADGGASGRITPISSRISSRSSVSLESFPENTKSLGALVH